ncbi:MAG: DUF3858 domain-containing protein [Cyclonatronaceae bacterium]
MLYQYLQENTRYVSIQLGIGGLQTETAEQTRRTRYGDCKALTNYLYAMLQIVGVESVPALIRSGNPGDDINPELPHQPFNHVILCVPPAPDETQSDSLWVEATSNTFAANYIGLGNAGKHVLMFNESGGRLTRTPALTADDNTQHRRAEVQLSESGEASAKVQTLYGGAQHEPIRAAERGMRPREQHSFLDAHVRTSDFAIEHYSFSSDTLAAGEAGLSLELRLPRYGRVMGNRMFFNPNLMQRRRYQVEENPSRSADIYLSYPYFDTDEIHWELPDGFVPEALPQPVSMMYAFGHFSSRVAYDEAGHRLIFRRELRLNEAQIDAAHYDDFRRMLNEAVRQDDQQVVLVKS